MSLNHFSLFTGIGGIDLAAEQAGFETVGQCEWADFQTRVLEKHWPDVPRWRDIRDVTAESIRQAGIDRIDLLSGGYPCQGESLVGKRRGKEDERWLWPEMFRIIQEAQPTWVLGENVMGHVTSGLDDVLTDLESEGYAARAFVLPACVFQAPHERYRVFVVGNSGGKPESQTYSPFGSVREKWNAWDNIARVIGGQVPTPYWQVHQPPIPGVDDGIPDRVDRSHALGNAVVPWQVYPILKAITEVEAHSHV